MKPGWWVLGGAAVGAGLWLAAPAVCRKLDFFRVHRVELVGVRHLAPRTVVSALKLPPKACVCDDFSAPERRVAALPGVSEAKITARVPGSVRVAIVETPPVALVRRADTLTLMDARGRVLPFDPVRDAPDLPVAAAPDSLAGMLLARVRELDPALFAQIATASRIGQDVVFDVGGRRLWFRADATAEELHAVMAVAQDLARRGRAYAELDGRFAGQVVVRGRGA